VIEEHSALEKSDIMLSSPGSHLSKMTHKKKYNHAVKDEPKPITSIWMET